MAAHLGLELDAFGRKYLRRVGARLSLIEDAQNDCIFWSNAEGCTIYAVRPGQCRQFPFWPELLESEAAWDAEQERCPGMGAGQHYSADEVEAICAGKGETGSHPPPTPPNETLTV